MTDRPVDVLLVSHTHWDLEWYRTFEAFRARLVDTVDPEEPVTKMPGGSSGAAA